MVVGRDACPYEPISLVWLQYNDLPPLTDFGGGGIAYRIRADQLFAKGIPKGYPQDCVEMVESEVTPSPVGILLIATRLSLTAE